MWAEAAASTGPPMLGAALALVLVSTLGFFAIAKLNLHGKLDSDQPEEEIELSEIVVEVPV